MADKFEIRLPWLPRSLTTSARVRPEQKARAAEMYRYTCKQESLDAIQAGKWDVQALRDLVAGGSELVVWLDFCPPNRRQAYYENRLMDTFHPGLLGLADALGIDEDQIRVRVFVKTDEVVNGGEVRAVITLKRPEA